MGTNQFQQLGRRGLLQGEIAQPIDDLMPNLPSFQDGGRALESKDLLNALPLVGKPGDFDQDYR